MIYKDKQETNSYQTETLTDLSGLETNGDYISCENTIPEVAESYTTFRNNLNILLDDVCSRDRGILLKKFGIGLPRPMLPKEIADQEGLSIARISQIIQNTTEKMISNSRKFNIDSKQMYEDLKNMMF
jgi:DNA-directed RNA polymerase sigma subunit (sigma70/sigma32)